MEQETSEQTQFIEWLRLKQPRDRTIENYMYYYQRFGSLRELNQRNVNQFLSDYNNPIAHAFLHNLKFYVLTNKEKFPEIAVEIGQITLPVVRSQKDKKIPKELSIEQIKAIETCFTREREKLMLLITFYGGLRVSELIGIKPYDFNWVKWKLDTTQPCELKITEDNAKGGRERVVLMPSHLMVRLREWIRNVQTKNPRADKNRPLWLIGNKRWTTLLAKASIKSLGRPINAHLLRHSCATYLLSIAKWNIRQVQEYLGHRDITSTQIYTRVHPEEVFNKFSETFNVA